MSARKPPDDVRRDAVLCPFGDVPLLDEDQPAPWWVSPRDLGGMLPRSRRRPRSTRGFDTRGTRALRSRPTLSPLRCAWVGSVVEGFACGEPLRRPRSSPCTPPTRPVALRAQRCIARAHGMRWRCGGERARELRPRAAHRCLHASRSYPSIATGRRGPRPRISNVAVRWRARCDLHACRGQAPQAASSSHTAGASEGDADAPR
jgi:hypothetical protein